MPNIELFGFPEFRAESITADIFRLFACKNYAEDMVVTIHGKTTVENARRTPQPFIRVTSTPQVFIDEIIAMLKTYFKGMADIEHLQLQAFYPRYELQRQEQEKIAHIILGEDIILPDEIARAFKLTYTEANLKHFADTMPSEEMLRWYKANGYAVVAGPPTPMGLWQFQLLGSGYFCLIASPSWYEQHSIHLDDKAKPEWLVICKRPRITRVETWDDKIRTLTKDERIPNVGELTWFILTFNLIQGARLFKKDYALTSSTTSDNNHITICDTGEENKVYINISDFPDHHPDCIICFAVAQKLQTETTK